MMIEASTWADAAMKLLETAIEGLSERIPA